VGRAHPTVLDSRLRGNDKTRWLAKEIQTEETVMFTIVMLIAVAVMAIAWAIYGIYDYKMRQEEKKQPKQISERLQKTRSEVADYAKKLAEYKPPKLKPPPPPGQA
jgi:Tfp pilus assembly protein PilO